jgi:hypothetical protein
MGDHETRYGPRKLGHQIAGSVLAQPIDALGHELPQRGLDLLYSTR